MLGELCQRVTPTGSEPISVKRDSIKELRRRPVLRAAESGAVDPTLQEVLATWRNLPRAVRDAIGVMVQAAKQRVR